MTMNDLNDTQREKLTSLLEAVESADDPEKAVWLCPEDRNDISEIRETIEAEA